MILSKIHLNIFTAFVLLAALSLAGCSKTSSGGQQGDGSISDQDLALSQQERFGEGNIPTAQSGSELVKDVYFGYDSSAVKADGREIIKQNAQAINQDASIFVEVEGHCDKRGTNEYNLALGEERAKAVASLLVSFGVAANRVSTISYGEEIPLDPAENESAYAKNRRVHFALYRKEARR